MKLSQFIFLLMSSFVFFPITGENHEIKKPKTDALRPPEFSSNEKILKSVLDELKNKKYDCKIIQVQQEIHGSWFIKPTFYTYKTNLPKNLIKEFQKCAGGYENYKGLDYLKDEEYSYYFAFLRISDSSGPPKDKISALINADKDAWNKNIDNYSSLFIQTYGLNRGGYIMWLFRENLLDNKYYKELEENKIFYPIKSQRPDNKEYDDENLQKVAENIERLIKAYKDSGNIKLLAEIDHNYSNLRCWFHIISNNISENYSDILRAFVAWLKCSNEEKPLYRAIVMGLFIMSGYEFDEATGNYIPNEQGKIMLDYIVENPIPENAERLKIIRNGGNEKLITDLMEKHKTKEKWDDLMKNEKKAKKKF